MRSTTSNTTPTAKVQARALSPLRLRRLALGLPMWQVARAVGKDTPTISRLERGERHDADLEEKVAEFLATVERRARKSVRA